MLEREMKFFERIIEVQLREKIKMIKVINMQIGSQRNNRCHICIETLARKLRKRTGTCSLI